MVTVDVYTIHLQAEAAQLDCLNQILSAEERERALGFRHSVNRRRFVVCRAVLRQVLSQYAQSEPGEINFIYNPHGKPSVPDSAIRFNVSHSDDWAMLAITAAVEVGIDIERINPQLDYDQLLENFFSPREVEQFRSLPVSEQADAFFRYWTRKEAYIKARGLGIGALLDSFAVSLAPGDAPALLGGVGPWSIQDLRAPAGYAAAVVAEGPDFVVSLCSASEVLARKRKK